jgi:phosphate-selective porin
MIRRIFVQIKIYIQRVSSYLVVVNFGLLLSVFLGDKFSVVEKILCYVAGMALVLLAGYLDTRFGLFQIEQSKINRQNPEVMELLSRVKSIENLIKESK